MKQPALDASGGSELLTLVGVRENNLKSLNLQIAHDTLTVLSGVSGSGKTSLAFETVYAEGGRRYIETFSPYTRQFLDRLHKPDLDAIHGVRPALALEQRNRTTSSRSTVGTVTEINDYLKLIWSHFGVLTCPDCGVTVERRTVATTVAAIERLLDGGEGTFGIAFPLELTGAANPASILEVLQAQGFLRLVVEGGSAVLRVDAMSGADLEQAAADRLYVLVDRLKAGSAGRERLYQTVHQAYSFGHGALSVLSGEAPFSEQARFLLGLRCSGCSRQFNEPKPSLFSFNSPLGACDCCHGFGRVLNIDPLMCVPDPRLSIDEGAIACWSTGSTARELRKLKEFCRTEGIDTSAPWVKLPKTARDKLFYGAKGSKFKGIMGWFDKLQQRRHKMHVRVLLSRYRSEAVCPECRGSRLKPEALLFSVAGATLPDAWAQPLDRLVPFFAELAERRGSDPVAEIAVEEVLSRLRYLCDIGLGYLTLDRQSRTLSGGEAQRVNLTSILGARMVSSMLVLDEPTIGLHGKDTYRLLEALFALRDRGNSLLVVEHDPEIISAADQVIDIGPRAGAEGGNVVFQGAVDQLLEQPGSLTGMHLKSGIGGRALREPRPLSAAKLLIRGAAAHNLKGIDVTIPLQRLAVITGVSGSGKSTLLTKCLYEPYQKLRLGMSAAALKRSGSGVHGIDGLKQLDAIVLIDQAPIGRSPRSNAGTYTGAWDIIRECLADTNDAQQLGLTKSAFSFNVDGGRCTVCKGAGQVRVEMQFLADVFVECEACGGSRFQDKVLGVRYAGRNVLELLQMSLSDVAELFRVSGDVERAQKVQRALAPLLELGLGYLRLGQPLSNVSGGEAQRIKLASYLAERKSTRCLFILDEPTTGLHPHNIADLQRTFDSLLARGHSVLCVEHNLDLIAGADWVIDLGPEGGEEGGRLVAEGTPQSLAERAAALPGSHTARLLADYVSGRRYGRPREQARRVKQTRAQRSRAIEVVGARHHNLKDITVAIPHNRLTVITGVSGSGKSTLAFDIVFAEGQRRYIDCLSPYARQYLTQIARADVDRVNAIPPTIAISQKTAPPLGVSTVATTTELYQFLRLLYSKVGAQHCVHDDTPITSLSPQSLTDAIARRYKGKRLFLFAPVVSGRKGYYNDLIQRALRAEIHRARIDGSMVSLEPEMRLERHKLHWISLLIGSLTVSDRDPGLLREAVEQCLLLGNGAVEICEGDLHAEPQLFSISRMCPECGRGYRELDPQDFSFRSARGVCTRCGGRGALTKKGHREEQCPDCGGSRIGPIGRHVYLGGKRIDELTALTPPELRSFLQSLSFEPRLMPLVQPIISELIHRLSVLTSVGLEYLSLDRDASSISGGEAQRLRLARALGSPLSGVCYVLDEPSIGLHPLDQEQLIGTLRGLRDAGNTVIVVEHDEDTIRQADHLIDIGPRGGAEGGRVVVEGTVAEVERCPESLTGQALRERGLPPAASASQRRAAAGSITLRGARTNNLRNLNVAIPKGKLTAVIGVSGAGKSSLVHGTLVPAVVEEFEGAAARAELYPKTWEAISGLDGVERLLEIDQSPVGKTSSSTPASYLGVFDEIRKLYALLPEAQAEGWGPSHFSFNTGKGRCEECQGKGFLKVPMSFLPEATTVCEACNGLRYGEATLQVKYQGLSIGELLQKTFAEARAILCNHPKPCRTLDIVLDLGLGYLSLGQPTHTLSGGEAQRIKIARELGHREATKTLYILDEPTIGLHMIDVEKLRRVLEALVDGGNTVVLIEHNLDIIRAADHLIELGPGPGAAGGSILFEGAPDKLLSHAQPTPTKRYLAAAHTPAAAAPARPRRTRARARLHAAAGEGA